MCALQPEVQQWDPIVALDGGVSGIKPYETIIPGSKQWLKPKGIVVLEIPHQCAQTLLEFGKIYFSEVSLHQDTMQRWRYLLLHSDISSLYSGDL